MQTDVAWYFFMHSTLSSASCWLDVVYVAVCVNLGMYVCTYVCMYIYACRSIVSPRRAPSRVSPTDTSDKDMTMSLDKQPPHIAVAKVTHVFVYICTYAHVCV